MNSHRRDLLFSVLILGVALMCGAISFSYPADSSGFPRAISVLLALLAVVDLLRNTVALRRARSVQVDGDDVHVPVISQERRQQLRAALPVFASAPFYILAVYLFDFEIATYLFLVAAMFALGERRPTVIVFVSLFMLLIVKILFFELLDVSRADAFFVWGRELAGILNA